MNVLIIGASGKVGGHTVDSAIEKGHRVRAGARTPSDIDVTHPRLEAVKTDVLKPETLGPAIKGQDAVILTFGAPLNKDTILHTPDLCEIGTRNIIAAMRAHAVNRLICMTAIGTGDSEGHGRFVFRNIIEPVLLGRIMEDRTRQEAVVREMAPEGWTIVRPTELADRDSQDIRVIHDVENEKEPETIARKDVGRFLVACLEKDELIGETVLITN